MVQSVYIISTSAFFEQKNYFYIRSKIGKSFEFYCLKVITNDKKQMEVFKYQTSPRLLCLQ